MLRINPWQITLVAIICVAAVLFALPNLFSRAALDSYPSWLPSNQVNLGLDLQGGSHLLLEVQLEEIVRERITTLVDDTRIALRKARIGYTGLKAGSRQVTLKLTDLATIEQAEDLLEDVDPEIAVDITDDGKVTIVLTEIGRAHV